MPFFDRIFGWIRAASGYRIFWLGGPLLLYAWTLSGPFVSDDFHMLGKAERYLRGESTEPALYRFARNDEDWDRLRGQGTIPWWLHGRQDYFRPISEWSFCFDVWLFGRHPLGPRIVSLLLFAVLLLAVHALFASASGDVVCAGTATYFFGLSQTLTPPVTWISNRNDLLATLGVTLAAWGYWQSRNRPRVWHPLVAAAGFAFGVLSKESAIALAPVLVGYELVVRRKRTARFQNLPAAATTIVVLVLALGYLAYYRYARPWAFELNSAHGGQMTPTLRWPLSMLLYFAVWTCGFPIDVLYLATATQTWIVAACGGLLALAVACFLRRVIREDSAGMFFVLWALFFLLPGLLAVSASARVACTATIGWAYLLAAMLVGKDGRGAGLPRRLRHWLHNVNTIASISCAVGTVLFVKSAESVADRRIDELIARASPPLAEGDVVVALRAESVLENICGGDRLAYAAGLRSASLVFLLPVGVDATAEVEDTHTIRLRARGVSLMGAPLHRLAMPRDWKPVAGQVFKLPDFSIEIAEVGKDDFVEALRVRFREPLTSSRLHFSPAEFDATIRAGRSAAGSR